MLYPSAPDLVIDGFADAVCTALGLHDSHPRFATAIGLDCQGVVRDLTLFTDADGTVEEAIWWAECMIVNDVWISQVLLISTDDVVPAGPAPEAWLDRWHEIQDRFDDLDIELLDWLRTDGDQVRSMLISDGGDWVR